MKETRGNSILKRCVLPLVVLTLLFSCRLFEMPVSDVDILESKCSISTKMQPSSFSQDNSTVLKIMFDKEFLDQSAKKLSGSVKVNTETFDNPPSPLENPDYWKKFYKFHEYLFQTFPLIFKESKDLIEVEYVNTFGLLITVKGSDSDKKPLMLMAHQDTVPVQVETLDKWTYPPFEGHFDGEFIYGRGSSDCKNTLIGILETLEILLKQDFKPKRSIIISLMADEEVGGRHFADHAGKLLEERYGKDSMFTIIDEGGIGFTELGGSYFALPATGEKGYVDNVISLTTPGGHSSVPPDHTSIGIMSELLVRVELNPFDIILSEENPTFQYLTCLAEHSQNFDSTLRSNILNALKDSKLYNKVVDYVSGVASLKNLFKTTQAIDIIKGGAKSNALPEHVEATLNQRVAIESSVQETVDHLVEMHLKPIAEKYNLGLIVHGETIFEPTANGFFDLKKTLNFNPAPSTPTSGKEWDLFAGTIRHIYEDFIFPEKFVDSELVVSPSVMSGNTDTKSMWNLSKYIYRYQPGDLDTLVGTHAHSVDEHINIGSHLQVISFYYEYISLLDETDV